MNNKFTIGVCATLLAILPDVGMAEEPSAIVKFHPSTKGLDAFSDAGMEAIDPKIPTPPTPVAQINSVDDLSDVDPDHWAYEALESLVDRYGCLRGYPDGTFRGNRTLTRYEFAAALDACVDAVIEGIGNGEDIDLDPFINLENEFASELATLRGRVDSLETRTDVLEEQRFTRTTTILGGEAIFGLATGFGGSPPGGGEANTVFHNQVRLQTVTTFTGLDRLRLELAAGNFSDRGFGGADAFNTDMALLSYQSDTGNSVILNKLEYRFPAFDDRVVFTIRPVGFSLSSVLTANSGYFNAGGGAISRFAEANPLFKIGRLDAGVGFDWLVDERIRLQVAYGTRDSNNPQENNGLFNSDHNAFGVQALLIPARNLLTGITYVNSYAEDGRLDTFTGSFQADTSGRIGDPAHIHGLGGSLQWRFAPDLTFGTWGGLMQTDYIDSDAEATTTTYLFSLGYSDPFGREGDLLAFLFGQPPKLVDGDDGVVEDEDTSLHFELFYRYLVNDNIAVTPGFFWVTNSEHADANEDVFIGVVRTTFRF